MDIHNQMFERMDLFYDLDLHDLYYTQVGGRTQFRHPLGPCTDHQLSEFLAGDGECTDTDRS